MGDVARQLGVKGEGNFEGRVFTNDDFSSSPIPPAPENAPVFPTADGNDGAPSLSSANTSVADSSWAAGKAKIEQFLRKTENLTEQQYADRMLGADLAEVQFPGRSSWQTKLYAEHQEYVDDAKLCISDRVSDIGRRQDGACSRLDSDKHAVQSLREKGKALAQEWKSRQETLAPH